MDIQIPLIVRYNGIHKLLHRSRIYSYFQGSSPFHSLQLRKENDKEIIHFISISKDNTRLRLVLTIVDLFKYKRIAVHRE